MNDELIGVKEVMEILKVSKSKGYSIMQNLNKELKKMGFYVIFLSCFYFVLPHS